MTASRTIAFRFAFLTVAGLLVATARAEPPSPADLVEGRVPSPPALGSRKREVGVEVAAPIAMPSVVKAKDGRWLMIGSGQVCSSSDGGKTWTKPEPLGAGVQFAVRLRSGKLGGPSADGFFYTSDDDGKLWQKGGKTAVGDVPAAANEAGGSALLVQNKAGRLLMPMRFTSGAGHMGLYENSGAWGTLGGKLTMLEGHAHWPEPDITHVVYSDNEGQTWDRSEGGIMIWHQDGHGGMWPCDEPCAVEAKNGDFVLFLRTSLGRVYTARSGPVDTVRGDGKRVQYPAGHRFDYPRPTELAASYSPCVVRRIPKTGDWLIVWNQVSGDEIRAGYRRGRLSSAVSKNEGKTWQHFRTIDSVVLPPVGRVAPDKEPRMARGLDYVGVVPDDYGAVHYPTLELADDTVLVFWDRVAVKPRPGDVTGRRMWAVPLSWFYKDEPALAAGPKVVIHTPGDNGKTWIATTVPVDHYDGRFYVRMSDLSTRLKSPVGRLGHDLYAPLHQVVTCLGWTPHYDGSRLKDAAEPRLSVYCTHPHAEAPPLPKVEPVAVRPVVVSGKAAGGYAAFPDVCRTPRGDLLCVFYSGYGHVSKPNKEWPKGGRVMAVRSADDGKTWGEPFVLADTVHDDRDPHVAALRDGTLVCNWFAAANPDKPLPGNRPIAIFLSRSTDDGKTWGEPAELKIDSPTWFACSAPVRELPDGSLILGLYTEDEKAKSAWGATIKSYDGGKTWKDLALIGEKSGVYLDAETDVVRLKDGTLLAALRSSKVDLHFATSADGGKTWGKVYSSGFKGHCPHFLRHSGGALLLSHRLPGTALHWSLDEGKTWQGPLQIDQVIGAYPSCVELADGGVYCVYYEEGSGSSIRGARLTVGRSGVTLGGGPK